jgi:hypothetical protein
MGAQSNADGENMSKLDNRGMTFVVGKKMKQ